MTLTSLPENVKNGHRLQIKMRSGWKDSLTWPKVYSKREAIQLAKMLSTGTQTEWRAVKASESAVS